MIIFIPTTPTLPTTFDLALIDTKFKFPQVWKTNIAIDQSFLSVLEGTLEGIINQTLMLILLQC
jgi:hypothetical protein